MNTEEIFIEVEHTDRSKEITAALNHQIDSTLKFLPLHNKNDPGSYIASKPYTSSDVMIRFAYVTEDNVLHLDGEVVLTLNRFIDISEAIITAKLYSDVINDWEEDAEYILSKLEKFQIDASFLDGLPTVKEILKFMPLAAFLFDDDGMIFESDLIEQPLSTAPEIAQTTVTQTEPKFVEDEEEMMHIEEYIHGAGEDDDLGIESDEYSLFYIDQDFGA